MSIGYLNYIVLILNEPLTIQTNSCIIYNSRGDVMAMTETIRIALVKCGNLSESELARRMGISPQNLHNKMKRDNFTETDLQEIANALGLELRIEFVRPETGEKV
jgi:hypothetical protein